jgi:hypothetical protein
LNPPPNTTCWNLDYNLLKQYFKHHHHYINTISSTFEIHDAKVTLIDEEHLLNVKAETLELSKREEKPAPRVMCPKVD